MDRTVIVPSTKDQANEIVVVVRHAHRDWILKTNPIHAMLVIWDGQRT